MWYRALLFVHILAAMAWVGGGLIIHITQLKALRRGGRPAIDRARGDLAWADTWLAVPAPLLVVGTGIAMVAVNGGWRFSQPWIWASIALVVIYQGLALTLGARQYRQLQERDADRTRVADPMSSLVSLGNVLISLLVGVVFLMVIKPGVS